jgi:hypothetical protein
MPIKINNLPDEPSIRGPYETDRQARADVSGIYANGHHSSHRGALGEANLAYLREACERTGLTLGTYDSRILAWFAGWEPETCAVLVGLITRAHAAGRASSNAVPLLDPYCRAGQHAICPGRLCQCPHCQHRLPQ